MALLAPADRLALTREPESAYSISCTDLPSESRRVPRLTSSVRSPEKLITPLIVALKKPDTSVVLAARSSSTVSPVVSTLRESAVVAEFISRRTLLPLRVKTESTATLTSTSPASASEALAAPRPSSGVVVDITTASQPLVALKLRSPRFSVAVRLRAPTSSSCTSVLTVLLERAAKARSPLSVPRPLMTRLAPRASKRETRSASAMVSVWLTPPWLKVTSTARPKVLAT